MLNAAPRMAALINLGDSPLVGLLVLIIVVGLVIWLALWIWDTFLARVLAEPFNSGGRTLIIIIGVLIVVVRALEVIFGITVLSGG